jgi:hypothetical protein
VQAVLERLDSRLRGNDKKSSLAGFLARAIMQADAEEAQ